MTKHINYRILLTKQPEGGFTFTVPASFDCITYGENIEEAITVAKEAIKLYVESLIAHGEAIPTEENTFEYSVSVVA